MMDSMVDRRAKNLRLDGQVDFEYLELRKHYLESLRKSNDITCRNRTPDHAALDWELQMLAIGSGLSSDAPPYLSERSNCCSQAD